MTNNTIPERNTSPYGFCPKCGYAGASRERRLNGNDTCVKGHTYPSAYAIRFKLYWRENIPKLVLRELKRGDTAVLVREDGVTPAFHVVWAPMLKEFRERAFPTSVATE